MNDVTATEPSRSTARPRWLVLLLLGRVSNLPTVWTNCLAGLMLAGVPLRAGLVWLPIALSLAYTGGMFLNDAFDEQFDRAVRPNRPIPRGDISATTVYGLGFAMLAGGTALVGFSTNWKAEPLGWMVVLAGMIVYYNYRHKSDPLSPLIMALCRVLVYLVSAAALASALDMRVLIGAVTLAGYLIGLTYIAKQENLTEVRNLWPLALLALPLIHLLRGANLIAGMAFVGWVLYALSFLIEKPRKIPVAVISLIAGISLVDAMIVSTTTDQAGWIILAAIGFALTSVFQRFIPGT